MKYHQITEPRVQARIIRRRLANILMTIRKLFLLAFTIMDWNFDASLPKQLWFLAILSSCSHMTFLLTCVWHARLSQKRAAQLSHVQHSILFPY